MIGRSFLAASYALLTCSLPAAAGGGALDYADHAHAEGRVDLPGTFARQVVTVGNHAYVANLDELVVLDISDRGNPFVVGSLDLPAKSVVAMPGIGGPACILVGTDVAAHYVNITDPTSPVSVGAEPIAGGAFDLDSYQGPNDTIYVHGANGTCYFTFETTQCGDFDNPRTVALGLAATDVTGTHDRAVVTSSSGLSTIDPTTNPPTVRTPVGQSADHVARLSNNHIVTSSLTWGVRTWDVNDLDAPVEVADWSFSAYGVQEVGNDTFLVGDADFGARIFDASDLQAIHQTASLHLPGDVQSFARSGATIVAVGQQSLGLTTIDAANLTSPPPLGEDSIVFDPGDVFTDSSNHLFSVGPSSVFVHDVSDPSNPTYHAEVPSFGAQSGTVFSDHLFLSGFGGMSTWNISDLANPQFLGFFAPQTTHVRGMPQHEIVVRTVPGRANAEDVESVDVSDPANPVILSNNALPETTQGMAVNGSRAALALGASGVQVWDYSDPGDPVVTSFSTTEPAYDVSMPGIGDVIVVGYQQAIDLFDGLGNPGGRYDMITIAPDVYITGIHAIQEVVLRGGAPRTIVYVTVSVGSVFVIDATDFNTPFLVGEYTDPTLYASCVTATDEAVFVGDVLVGDRILVLPPQSAGGPPTGILAGAGPAESHQLLGASWPNPFTATTRIPFSLPRSSRVELSVYDVTGRVIRTLAGGSYGSGSHTVTWDGRDESGRRASSGVYFVRLQAGDRSEAARIIRIR